MIKTSITIPDDVYNEAKGLSDNFSMLVTEALKEYMRMKAIEEAKSSFGKWQERDKSSVDIVNDLRKEETRKYAKRNN